MTDLDELKALAEAAKFSEPLQVDYQCLRVGLDDENLLAFLMHGDSEDGEYVCVDEEPTERDGPPSPRLEFIAALVNAFPDLLLRLEKAEGERGHVDRLQRSLLTSTEANEASAEKLRIANARISELEAALKQIKLNPNYGECKIIANRALGECDE